MTADYTTLANPLPNGVGCIVDRQLPADETRPRFEPSDVVSADNHYAATDDMGRPIAARNALGCSHRTFPGWGHAARGGAGAVNRGAALVHCILAANLQDGWDHGKRRAHLESEGISAEIVVPQSLLG